jgi:hypothetical protein
MPYKEFPKYRRTLKTHCKHGHPYDEANTHHEPSQWGEIRRVCRTCCRERMQRKRDNPLEKERGRLATAAWRKRNPEKYREGYERDHEEKKQILLDARIGGCVKCGETDPACLDFHHRNGKADKLGDIATIRRFGKERILAEIAKCDVLCTNCHRKLHRDERVNQEREEQ